MAPLAVVVAHLFVDHVPEFLYRGGRVYNVGTGRRLDLLEMVDALGAQIGGLEPKIVGKFRKGDIRHCYADISRIREELGFEPEVSFEQGIDDLAAWAENQEAEDRMAQTTDEQTSAGLTG